MANDTFDLSAFEEGLELTLKNGRAAFKGAYKHQLDELAGLSRAEIDAIIPGTKDLEAYDQLMIVVKEASRVNLAQGQLKRQIFKLGALGLTIAKRVPSLAAILA